MSRVDQLLSSIGIAFDKKGLKNISPEQVIIEVVSDSSFPNDKKAISLLMTWLDLFERYVHVERLKNMSKSLPNKELAILKSLALKVGKKSKKWLSLVEKTRTLPREVFASDNELLLEIKGIDKDFKKFGIHIAPIITSHKKKILPEIEILKSNTWIKNRLKYGTNLRADIVTIRELSLADTGYKAAKVSHCSINAAYRNWNELELLDSL